MCVDLCDFVDKILKNLDFFLKTAVYTYVHYYVLLNISYKNKSSIFKDL